MKDFGFKMKDFGSKSGTRRRLGCDVASLCVFICRNFGFDGAEGPQTGFLIDSEGQSDRQGRRKLQFRFLN